MSFTEGPVHQRSERLVEPPVAAAVVDVPVQREVVVPTTVATGGEVRRAYNSRFAPDAVIAAIVGLVILVVGLIAVIRGGFDGPMSDPVVEVMGFTHTTTLGLIEIILGAALLICGASSSRSGAVFFGALLGIGGFVGAVQAESFETSLALESSMAWLAVAAAVIVVLSALLMPRYARNSTSIERI